MKKLFISLFFAFGFTATAHAQGKGKIELGIGAGYNSYSVSSQFIQSSVGAGINVAGSLEYYFSDKWGIKTKLIYDSKGWNEGLIQDEDNQPFLQTNFRLKYLTVPVMANWHFGAKRNWYVNFGPYAGFLIDAKDTTLNSDLKADFRSTDFGLAVGIGVKIPVTDQLRLYLEYDGQGGFTNILVDSSETVTNSRSSFNVGLNFLLK